MLFSAYSAYAGWRAMVRSLKNLLLREDRVCPWWLVYTFDNPLRRFLHDPSTLFAGMVREGMTVADIGCGRGYFSIAMAGIVGDAGMVISVDIQQKMLDMTLKRAERAGVARRITPVLAAPDDIGIRGPVDFLLAFWMAHEVADSARFFNQAFSALKEEGKMLVAEPKMHVGRRRFSEIVQTARDAGFRDGDTPVIRLSRAVLLERN
jgi:2-polyprenyl-3-methyl-5-hydroxy-6-metoxy-1,4-benzoquinol methylase